jgi:hypothetical protein
LANIHKQGEKPVGKYEWLLYVILAGLAWGTYVPIIFYGGTELTGAKPGASPRLMAILCVGVAYFAIGVVFPVVMFITNWGGASWKEVNFSTTGLVFAGLAGVAGAVGAICVVFATQSAVAAGKELTPPDPAAYKVFIAPLIFGLAPIINVLVTVFWHPLKGNAANFGFTMPHPLLWVGIILVGVGAGLVLYSKELVEAAPPPAHQPTTKPSAAVGAAVGLPGAAVLESKPAASDHPNESKP